jgi:hypothetical protein
VIRAVDGHDVAAVSAAIAAAKKADKPTLICCKTVIGKGSPNLQGGDKVHGAALGDKEVAAVREYIGWSAAPFEIPADVYAAWDAKAPAPREADWNACSPIRAQFPAEAAELSRRMAGDLPAVRRRLAAGIAARREERKHRHPQGQPERHPGTGAVLPEFLGGSADLTGSNLTNWKECVAVRSGQPGNHINYGVREFGMSGHHERRRPARRLHPVRRHLPDLLRLQPQRPAHGCADEAAFAVRVHPRLDRPGRRRPDPPVGRARLVAAPDPEPGQLASMRHHRIDGGLGRSRQAQDGPRPDLLAPEPAVPGA